MFQANAMIELNQDSWKKLPQICRIEDTAAENLRWAESYYRI